MIPNAYPTIFGRISKIFLFKIGAISAVCIYGQKMTVYKCFGKYGKTRRNFILNIEENSFSRANRAFSKLVVNCRFLPIYATPQKLHQFWRVIFFWNSAGGGRKWPGWPDMHAGSSGLMIWHTLIKKIFWFHDFWRFYFKRKSGPLFWDSTVDFKMNFI